MAFEAAEIGDVTNMIALTIHIDVLIFHLLARQLLHVSKSLQYRTGIRPSTTQVVHLTRAWISENRFDRPCDIVTMDVITNLLPLVSINAVSPLKELCFHHVGQKSVEFNGRVVWSSQTTATKT